MVSGAPEAYDPAGSIEADARPTAITPSQPQYDRQEVVMTQAHQDQTHSSVCPTCKQLADAARTLRQNAGELKQPSPVIHTAVLTESELRVLCEHHSRQLVKNDFDWVVFQQSGGDWLPEETFHRSRLGYLDGLLGEGTAGEILGCVYKDADLDAEREAFDAVMDSEAPLRRFLVQAVVEDPIGHMSEDELFEAFQTWCGRLGLDPGDRKFFQAAMSYINCAFHVNVRTQRLYGAKPASSVS